ncbi:MAG TPA: S8 family serine peptidase [Bacteroidales bacterium]|nr:S8 family serine peptidase [Bacteroidales bacterium]
MKINRSSQGKRVIITLAIIMFSLATFAQVTFKNGVRTGLIKVKFTPEMAATVSQKMKTAMHTEAYSTGISTFDAVARSAKASKMYRLFDYDPNFESKLHKHGLDLWYIVEIDTAQDPRSVAIQFNSLKGIITAEPEHEKVLGPYSVIKYKAGIATSDALPFNDPLLKDQWHYDNAGQLGIGDADINLFNAWKKATGRSDIIVAVHDQGVDVTHEDLKDNMWINQSEYTGTKGVDDDQNGYVDDIYGYNFALRKGAIDPGYHGTHVAGTIAAVNNNGKGVCGIAGGNGTGNGVKIMSLQIFGGDALYEKTYIYAANNGAVISQNSWGYQEPGVFDVSLQDAIDYFVDEAGDYPGSPMKGGIVIFAAGNYNMDGEWYPGYYENTLSVASIGPEWKKASYSNYGTWVDISAQGGDTEAYGSKGGVLSTIPGNQYAYLEGTSMACPHVSGIAALALANSPKQITNSALWNLLVTGVREIEEFNPDFTGKLGSGAIDADLVTRTDMSKAPAAVTGLAVDAMAQDLAILSWTVPADEDDIQPLSFELYYSNQPLVKENLAAARKIEIRNNRKTGEAFTYEINNLSPLTQYYFALTSSDRWGNISDISNVATGTTNQGPSINVDENSQAIDLSIDASKASAATYDITILNEDIGLLRWKYFMRHKEVTADVNSAKIHYPVSGTLSAKPVIGRLTANPSPKAVKNSGPAVSAFTSSEKALASWPTNIIGETDIRLTNSAAGKFYISEEEGFNLTGVRLYLKHDPVNGPVIIEIYRGNQLPSKENLLLVQEYTNWNNSETFADITLQEQLFFNKGESFWIVYHVPAGNLFPLGIGYETQDDASANCLISFDMGKKWQSLEEALGSKDFAYVMAARSDYGYPGNYMTLTPDSGDIEGNSRDTVLLSVDASALVNGSYSANVVLSSNDAVKPQFRVPVTFTVTGQKPLIKPLDIQDFGPVFSGKTKTIDLLIENTGYGNYTVSDFTIDNAEFTLPEGSPWQVKARSSELVKIQFTPAHIGNCNGLLHVSNGINAFDIPLFGTGIETSKIEVNPALQSLNDVTIGDTLHAQVTVANTGKYPLKYFIPGFDTKDISTNWPAAYHKYGYKLRSNRDGETDPIPYEFEDISSTGKNITSEIKSEYNYYSLNLGFDFPYYNRVMHTIYIANKGFTTFDNTVNPINIPILNNSWSPKGYISPLGGYFNYEFVNGQVYYKTYPDRIILQYDKVGDGYNGTVTAQMVIHSNGNIRFYYDDMGYDANGQGSLTILMEDYDQTDGIMVHNWSNPVELHSGLAIGFDYPGPDIITEISNGSGFVMPGNSATIDITLSTASLVEGTVNRYLNVISNDPSNSQCNPLVRINITKGGNALPAVSSDTIKFGDVFKGDSKSRTITVKNNGTASCTVNACNWTNGKFSISGVLPAIVKPGLYSTFTIHVPSVNLGPVEDHLVLSYNDGSHDTIYVNARIVEAPDILTDLSAIHAGLNRGETAEYPFGIKNTGAGALEVSVVGKDWLSFTTEQNPDATGYAFEKSNSGGVYQWTDLFENGGIHLPVAKDPTDKEQFFKKIGLPFAFEFYGKPYDSLKIAENGVVTFDQDPEVSFFTDTIPTTMFTGPSIMPCWSFGGFDFVNYNPDEIGIFYQADTNKVVIEWRYILDNFGMGDPFSFQLMLFRNGSMKFLYKPELGKVDAITGFGAVGLQENSGNGFMINDHMALDHGDGLVFTVVPVPGYLVDPGATLNGTITLDAREIFAGNHIADLQVISNVPSKESLLKPVDLTVTGSISLEMPDTTDFGEQITYSDESGIHNYFTDLVIKNDGETPLEITNISMSEETQPLALMLWTEGNEWFPGYWDYVFNIFSPMAWETPVYKLMPGDKLNARAAFYPESEGDYINDVILTTNAGEMRFTLKGKALAAPVLEVDQTPVQITMIQPTESADQSIAFNNIAGGSELSYRIGIEYFRPVENIIPYEKYVQGDSITNLKAVPALSSQLKVPESGNYNRTLKYTEKTSPDGFLGTGGVAPFSLAVKFNAGTSSFNLSDVETWFKPETTESGTIAAEIRAGGTNIVNSKVLAQGSAVYTSSEEDNTGYILTIHMDDTAFIYPGEDFYVIITYPLGIAHPQGYVDRQAQMAGRYLYSDEGAWFDLQDIYSYKKYGWLIRAHEMTPVAGSWLTVVSDTTGTLTMGETDSLKLVADGRFAQRGTQHANVVFRSNDPYHAEVKVPVELHLNDAPQFFNSPGQVYMNENSSRTIKIDVVDLEGNAFTVKSKENYGNASMSFEDGVMTVQLNASYGDEGEHEYTFVAEDEQGAAREHVLKVTVGNTNQAPVYIGAANAFNFHKTNDVTEFSIESLFADPDGDPFTFTATSEDESLARIYTSDEGIMVKTLAVGTTSFTFTLTDNHGAVNVVTMEVSVDNASAVNDVTEKPVIIYPNPSKGLATIVARDKAITGIRISTILGETIRLIPADKQEEVELDLTSLPPGTYMIEVLMNERRHIMRIVKE